MLIRLANQFGSPANNRGVWEAVKTPLRILVYGTVGFFWKATLSWTSTIARRSKCFEQSLAGNPV